MRYAKTMVTTRAKPDVPPLDPKSELVEMQSDEFNEEVIKLDLAKVCGVDADADHVPQGEADDQRHRNEAESYSDGEKEQELKKEVLDDTERLLQKGKEKDRQEADVKMKKESSKAEKESDEDSIDEREKLLQSQKEAEDGGIEMSTLNKMHTQDEATSSV